LEHCFKHRLAKVLLSDDGYAHSIAPQGVRELKASRVNARAVVVACDGIGVAGDARLGIDIPQANPAPVLVNVQMATRDGARNVLRITRALRHYIQSIHQVAAHPSEIHATRPELPCRLAGFGEVYMTGTIGTGGRPIEVLLVEDNPGDARLTQEAFRDAIGANCYISKPGLPNDVYRIVSRINDFWLTKVKLPSSAGLNGDALSIPGHRKSG
jgi:hypothetical protein